MTDSMDECRGHLAEMRAEREEHWGLTEEAIPARYLPESEEGARRLRADILHWKIRDLESGVNGLTFRGVPVVQLLSLTANVLEAESDITGSEDFADELRLRAALLRALTGGDEE